MKHLVALNIVLLILLAVMTTTNHRSIRTSLHAVATAESALEAANGWRRVSDGWQKLAVTWQTLTWQAMARRCL